MPLGRSLLLGQKTGESDVLLRPKAKVHDASLFLCDVFG
jgi:hypothetical protein